MKPLEAIPIDTTAQQAMAIIQKTPREVLHYLYCCVRSDGILRNRHPSF